MTNLLSLLAINLHAAEVPKEILLWPNGAPGSEGKTGDEKVRVTDAGDHVISNIHKPSITPSGSGHGFGLRPNDTKPAAKWIERFEEWLGDSGFLKKL